MQFGCLHITISGKQKRKTNEILKSTFKIVLKMACKGSSDVTLTPCAVSMLRQHAHILHRPVSLNQKVATKKKGIHILLMYVL